MSQLIEVEKLKPIEVYNSGNIDQILEKIAIDARSQLIDISTEKGRKDCASLAYRIAQSKTFLDKMGKALGDDARRQLDTLNAERKKCVDFLDKLKDEIRKPLTDWENAEKNRVANHENELSKIIQSGIFVELNWQSLKSDFVESKISELKLKDRDWQEFKARSTQEIDSAVKKHETALAKIKQYESEQEELRKFREAEALRIQKERDEKIANEAAEKARIESEQKAKVEADRIARQAELERQRVEKEKRYAEEKIAAIQREKELAELRAKAATEKAEREKQIAIENERKKIEQEKIAAAEAERVRENNKKHRAKINNEVLDALVSIGVSDEQGKKIISEIVTGNIPHTKISY